MEKNTLQPAGGNTEARARTDEGPRGCAEGIPQGGRDGETSPDFNGRRGAHKRGGEEECGRASETGKSGTA